MHTTLDPKVETLNDLQGRLYSMYNVKKRLALRIPRLSPGTVLQRLKKTLNCSSLSYCAISSDASTEFGHLRSAPIGLAPLINRSTRSSRKDAAF